MISRSCVAGSKLARARSKTDQDGRGLTKVISRGSDPSSCPVRAVRDWLELARIEDGPVFRSVDRHGNVSPKRLSAQSVALVHKRSAAAVGIPTDDIAGHSLRAGFVTAKKHRPDEAAIMDQNGHRSIVMLQRYHRRAKKWVEPAGDKAGVLSNDACRSRSSDALKSRCRARPR